MTLRKAVNGSLPGKSLFGGGGVECELVGCRSYLAPGAVGDVEMCVGFGPRPAVAFASAHVQDRRGSRTMSTCSSRSVLFCDET